MIIVAKAGSHNYDLLLHKIWAYSDRHTPGARLLCKHGQCNSDFISCNIIVHTYVNTMSYTSFEWDEAKSRRNIHKQGVSFPSATTFFSLPHLVRLDEREGYSEDRWLAIGCIGPVIGVVVFTERGEDEGNKSIRIISARKASTREIELYEKEI
jgi:uncharacterized DUF497 family protein